MQFLLRSIKQLVCVPAGGKPYKTGEAMRDLGVIENAAVLIEGGCITWVGRDADFGQTLARDATVFDASEYVVFPGFVDAHTHLIFGGSREHEFAMRAKGKTYQQIAEAGGGILSTVRATREMPKKDLKKKARRYLDAMLRQGTTTVEVKTGYGLDLETELKMLEIVHEFQKEHLATVVGTFLGAHAFPPEFRGGREDAYVDLICETMLPHVKRRGVAAFCDVFCEQGYFTVEQSRRILQIARENGLGLKVHADELGSSGGSMLAAELGAVSADHLDHSSHADMAALASAGVVGVLLPGVSFFLNHNHADARALIASGTPTAIATDFNPGSCMSYSLPMMMTIAVAQMKMTPEEAITACTLNAAAALKLSATHGSIETGKAADLVMFNIPNYRTLAYHFGELHPVRVIKDGVLLEF